MADCGLCHYGEEAEEICGRLWSSQDCTAHKKCMQYSALLVQYKFDSFGGFKIKKVIEEMKRGSKLKCSLCPKKSKKDRMCRGATSGCAWPRCGKTFHFYCARKDKKALTCRMVVTNKETGSKLVKYRVFCGEFHKNKYEEKELNDSPVDIDINYVSDSDEEDDSNLSLPPVNLSQSSSESDHESSTSDVDAAVATDHSSTTDDDFSKEMREAVASGQKKKNSGRRRTLPSSRALCIKLSLPRKQAKRKTPVKLASSSLSSDGSDDSGQEFREVGVKRESPEKQKKKKKSPVKVVVSDLSSSHSDEEATGYEEGSDVSHETDEFDKIIKEALPNIGSYLNGVKKDQSEEEEEEKEMPSPTKRGPGRPPKVSKDSSTIRKSSSASDMEKSPRGPGVEEDPSKEEEEQQEMQSPKKRSPGRPPKVRRGRLPKVREDSSAIKKSSSSSDVEKSASADTSGDSKSKATSSISKRLFQAEGNVLNNTSHNSQQPDDKTVTKVKKAEDDDYVLAFLASGKLSKDVKCELKLLGEKTTGVSASRVYIWPHVTKMSYPLMLYYLRQLTNVLREGDSPEVERLIFHLSPADLEGYQGYITFNKELGDDLEGKIYRKLPSTITDNLKAAESQYGECVAKLYKWKGSSTPESHVLFLIISDTIDLTHTMRRRLNSKRKLVRWKPDSRIVRCNISQEQKNSYRSLEYKGLCHWLSSKLNTLNIHFFPIEEILQVEDEKSVTLQLWHHCRSTMESTLESPSLVFFLPVDREVMCYRAYVRKSIAALLGEHLTACHEMFCVVDVGSEVKMTQYSDIIGNLPPHVTVKVWSSLDPEKLTVSCVIVQFTMVTDSGVTGRISSDSTAEENQLAEVTDTDGPIANSGRGHLEELRSEASISHNNGSLSLSSKRSSKRKRSRRQTSANGRVSSSEELETPTGSSRKKSRKMQIDDDSDSSV